MKIIKFIIPSLLLFMPIGVFAGVCEDKGQTDCEAAAASGCYWSSGAFSEANSGCKQCVSGTYSIGAKCERCTAGHYCVNGVQKPCPAGTYNTNEDSSSVYDCTPCPAGKYSVAGASSCDNECTGPSLPNDSLLCSNYRFEFTSGGDRANSCQWRFGYNDDIDVYPVCDDENGCYCVSCGMPYEVSSTAKTIIFDGERMGPDPNSVKVCPNFSPLKLESDPNAVPYDPAGGNGIFKFYAIIKDEKVLISATREDDSAKYGTEIDIPNVTLKNGLNYDVILSIGDCKFETIGCGSYHNSTCKIKVSDGSCSAKNLRNAADNLSQVTLTTEWVLDVPVLIAKTRLIFSDANRDNKLHIKYLGADDACFKWAKNPADVELYRDGNPKLGDNCVNNETAINTGLDGYNKSGNSGVPFLGYTIGCWRKEADNNGNYGFNSQYIMLEEDFLNFKYPSDCRAQSGLTKELGEVTSSFASMGNKIWPGVSSYYYSAINSALAGAKTPEELNKRCFIVGLYGYPPCTPGCYCPDGGSTACTDSQSPFTSKRGSDNRSDCYLKSDVVFKEGDTPVTPSVKDLLGLSESFYKTIKLGE